MRPRRALGFYLPPSPLLEEHYGPTCQARLPPTHQKSTAKNHAAGPAEVGCLSCRPSRLLDSVATNSCKQKRYSSGPTLRGRAKVRIGSCSSPARLRRLAASPKPSGQGDDGLPKKSRVQAPCAKFTFRSHLRRMGPKGRAGDGKKTDALSQIHFQVPSQAPKSTWRRT